MMSSVIGALRKQPGGLSGDDSALKSFWDEFCVQVQDEESFFWAAYESTAIQFLLAELERAERHEREAVWLQSESGWDWLWEMDNRDDDSDTSPEAIPYEAEEAAKYLFSNYPCPAAEDFSNPAIAEYQGGAQRARFELDSSPYKG